MGSRYHAKNGKLTCLTLEDGADKVRLPVNRPIAFHSINKSDASQVSLSTMAVAVFRTTPPKAFFAVNSMMM